MTVAFSSGQVCWARDCGQQSRAESSLCLWGAGSVKILTQLVGLDQPAVGEFPTSGRGPERGSLISLPWSPRYWWSPQEHDKGTQSEGQKVNVWYLPSSGWETIWGSRKYGRSVSQREGQ